MIQKFETQVINQGQKVMSTQFALPPKIKLDKNGDANFNNSSNFKNQSAITTKQKVSQQVQERCQQALLSARKQIKPPLTIHSSLFASSQKFNSGVLSSARQSQTNLLSANTNSNSKLVFNQSSQRINTPRQTINFQSNDQQQENSIRNFFKESGQKERRFEELEINENPIDDMMSTYRMNFNPINMIDTDVCNTARSHNLRNGENTYDMLQFKLQNKISKAPRVKKSCLKNTNQSTQFIDKTSPSNQFHSHQTKYLRFNENIELINVFLQNIYRDDNQKESEDDIEKQFRKYFNVSETQNSSPITNQNESYDPQVYNMKESDIWIQVYEQLDILQPSLNKSLWELPITKLDIILEKEFSLIRKLQIIDEDAHVQTVETVEYIEQIQKQNEELQREIQGLQLKEMKKRKIQTNEFEVSRDSYHSNEKAQTNTQSLTSVDEFELMWEKLEKEKENLDLKYQTIKPTLEASFLDQSFVQQTQQQESLTSNKPNSPKEWEKKWNKVLREEKRKIDGETSFMDINDSFSEQFNGLIQTFDESQLSKQADQIINEQNEEKQLKSKQKNALENQLLQDQTIQKLYRKQNNEQNSQNQDRSAKNNVQDCYKNSECDKAKIQNSQKTLSIYEDKENNANQNNISNKTGLRNNLSKDMQAFEKQYAKYELRLKMIEDELLDYNSKCSELSKEESVSPQQRKQVIQPRQSKIDQRLQQIETPKISQKHQENADSYSSKDMLKSPKQQKNQLLGSQFSERDHETPQFNKNARQDAISPTNMGRSIAFKQQMLI
eukprot:403341089